MHQEQTSAEKTCRMFLALVVALEVAACSPSGKPEPAVPPPPNAEATTVPQTPPPTPPAVAAIPEVEVRRLLDAWLAAQNGGDFDTYAAVYAQKFEGVKRAGERVYNFDRDGWLKDRKRMFEKPMAVSADNAQVLATPTFATVTFSQRWSSGTYSDVGDKRLLIVKEQDALRIRSETMLASKVAGETVAEAPPLAEFMLVVGSGDALYVLLDEMADPSLAADVAPGLRGGDYDAMALKPVRPEKLPTDAAAVMGQTFDVYAQRGRVCTAVLEAPSLMRELVGNAVDLSEDYFGSNPKETAQHVWEMGAASTLLVAELRVTSGRCENPLWARSAALPAPRIFAPTETGDAPASEISLDALHRLPAYRAGTRQLRDEGVKLKPQEAWEAEGSLRFQQWRSDTRAFETIEAERGGCSEPYASAWALLELTNQGTAVSVVPMDRRAPGEFRTTAVIDFNNDGLIEVIGFAWQSDATLLLRVVNGKLTPTLAATRTFIGCHC